MNEISFQNSIETVVPMGIKDTQGTDKVDGSFTSILKHTINTVNQAQIEADQAVQELATGNEKDIHQTMIALEKAEVSFQLMMQVRNKIVSAYEEIMRMQI
jgi:flagellar hook-basal body complex protein FliE